jgi:predicted GIY-YIG superfamily endonuclease
MPTTETARLRSQPPAANWIVYILRCRDGSLYTGITNNLPRRLATHAAGKASRYTRSRLPVRLAYQEPQPTKSLALKREAAIKALPRAAKLRLLGVKQTGPRAEGYNSATRGKARGRRIPSHPVRARSSVG